MLIWKDFEDSTFKQYAEFLSARMQANLLPADWKPSTATTTLESLGVSVADSIRGLPLLVACNPRGRAPRAITAPRRRPFFCASEADMRNAP